MNIVVFQVVNYTLSFLMWMIIGRVMMKLIFGNRQNIMALAFIKVTEPVYRFTRTIMPFAGENYIPALSIALIIAVRLAFVLLVRPATNR